MTDKDPFPSVPHGHCYEKGYKIEIPSGNVYSSKCKLIGKAKENEMAQLMADSSFQTFIREAKAAFCSKNAGKRSKKRSVYINRRNTIHESIIVDLHIYPVEAYVVSVPKVICSGGQFHELGLPNENT